MTWKRGKRRRNPLWHTRWDPPMHNAAMRRRKLARRLLREQDAGRMPRDVAAAAYLRALGLPLMPWQADILTWWHEGLTVRVETKPIVVSTMLPSPIADRARRGFMNDFSFLDEPYRLRPTTGGFND